MKKLLSVITAGLLLAAATYAQEVGVLVDALVDKKLLTPQEAERIRAGLAKENAETPAGKLKLSDSITELKISGDGRLRYQYDNVQSQLNSPAPAGSTAALQGANPNNNQRSRFRFRLRLNADLKFGENFFAGLGLATGQAADSNMQTFENGFDNYSIYINKAFMGWKPTDWLKIVVGKQDNPFYTTELTWDQDIYPQGFVEQVDIGKALFPDSNFSLQFIAGQFIFDDNNEFNLDSDLKTDAWLFVEQLKATYKFNKDTSLTIAPGFYTYTAADLSGLLNTRAFGAGAGVGPVTAVQTGVTTQTTTSVVNTVQETVNAAGTATTRVVTPTTVTSVVTTTTAPDGTRTVATTSNTVRPGAATTTVLPVGGTPNRQITTANTVASTTAAPVTVVPSTVTVIPAVSGETRQQNVITAPGDLSFKLGGLKTKLYWDVVYNLTGRERYENIYSLSGYNSRDALAWFVGIQFGDNKKQGDWQAYVNYREIGMASVDPNLNDSDWAQSALNMRGFKIGLSYNFTDWLYASATYSTAWNLKKNLVGGQATSGAAIADLNAVDVVQFELNWKF